MGTVQRSGATAALGLVLVASVVVLMLAGRETTFYFDEWDFVTQRRDWNLHVLLSAHNEHLSAVPVLIYKLLLETVGLDAYGAFRFVLAALNAIVGLLLFLFAAPRVGRWAAVGLTALAVFMGPGYMDLLWAFQIGFLVSLAAGLGALLAIERERHLLACALLVVAVGSASLGLPFVVVAGLELAWTRRRALWVVAVPLALYGAWYLRYGVSAAELRNVADVPRWIFDSSAAAAGALTGLGKTYGPALSLLVWIAVGLAVVRAVPLRARLAAVIVLPLVFWALTALARADQSAPDESRYLYPGGLFLALLLAEALRGRSVAGRAAVVLGVAVGLGVVANANELEKGGNLLRDRGREVTAAVTALELLGRDGVPAGVRPEPIQIQIVAGAYFDTVADYGSSPAVPPAELPEAPAALRGATDAALVRLGAAGVEPGGTPRTGTAPEVISAAGVSTTVDGACVRATPSGPGADLAVTAPGGALVVEAGGSAVGIRVRRFGDEVDDKAGAVGEVAADATSTVRLRRDASDRPWLVSARSGAPFRACAGG